MTEVPGKREQKRAELRRKLINAARARILSEGLSGVRARDVTKDAGCALGALYNAFEDLNGLILHVNAATLVRLGEKLHDVASKEQGAEAKLMALALGYLAFADENRALWSAVFDHSMPIGQEIPEWYSAEHFVLIEEISSPLSMLYTKKSEDELIAMSRTLFSAVHGIVAIGLQEKMVAISRDRIEQQLKEFLEAMITGLKHHKSSQ